MLSQTPNKINKLSSDIINTIDSNKIITKLSLVVKELIENSLDANCKHISIFLKDNGLSLIEVKDDGVGIDEDNLNLLCKRFTSSKLKDYDKDLASLQTYGFRGEALSILTYISQVTIISRTKDSLYGFEAIFRNGCLVSPLKNESNNSIKKTACDIGTLIKVENIFYNNPVRKNAFDKVESLKEIINLVQNYAFHFYNISFSLVSNTYMSNKILNTIAFNDSLIDSFEAKKSLALRLFSQHISDNLFCFKNNDLKLIGIEYECCFTKPSAHLDKNYFILFLNNRLIINSSIKRMIDQSYAKFLIKKGCYFVYLNIKCDPKRIDVNVKGNKSEVYLEDEAELINAVKKQLEENLNEEISSKNYYTADYSDFKKKEISFLDFNSDFSTNSYAKDKVRVDSKTMSIENFLNKQHDYSNNIDWNSTQNNNSIFNDTIKTIFNSIFSDDKFNQEINEIIKNSFFIGYEEETNFTFIQHNTSMYLINSKLLFEEYFLFILLNQSFDKIENIKINSEYNLNDLINFVEENLYENTLNKETIKDKLKAKINIFNSLNIKIDDSFQMVEAPFINLEVANKFKHLYLTYIPMLYYSLMERIEKPIKEAIISNENLNFILDVYKIISHYTANFYLEYLSKIGLEEANKYLRNVFYVLIKTEKFFIRKNIKEAELLEKVIDTETLYTVFERC